MSAIDKKKAKTHKGDPAMESGLDEATASAMERYRRAVNYLAAAQIYLKDNPLLEEPLRRGNIAGWAHRSGAGQAPTTGRTPRSCSPAAATH